MNEENTTPRYTGRGTDHQDTGSIPVDEQERI